MRSRDGVPPHDHDAEIGLIGSVLIDPSCLAYCQQHVTPDDFHEGRHRIIWQAMEDMSIQNVAPDVLTLRNELRNTGSLDKVGGEVYLSLLLGGVASAVRAESYAIAVKRQADLRAIITATSLAEFSCYENRDPADIRNNLFRDMNSSDTTGSTESIAEVAERITPGSTMALGFDTGLVDLQNATGGLYVGVNLIAGRPGAGKTTLCLQLGLRAVKAGHKWFIVSADQPSETLTVLMWCHLARKGEDQFVRDATYDRIVSSPIHYYRGRFELTRILSQIRLMAARGYDWVLVDYLSLIEVPGLDHSHDMAERAIKALKTLSNELKLTCVVVQSIRKNDSTSSELEDVGGRMEVTHAPEQVWFLSPGKTGTDPVVLSVLKSRHAGRGRVDLDLRGAIHTFTDWGANVLPPVVETGGDPGASGEVAGVPDEGRVEDRVAPIQGFPPPGPGPDPGGRIRAASLASGFVPGKNIGRVIGPDDPIPF